MKHTEEKPYKCSYLEKKTFNKNIILSYTWEYAMERSHTYTAILIRLSYRTAILCVTLGNTQERDHTDVAIVENLSHRNIISRYTQGYTLGRNHTHAAIVTRLSQGRMLLSIFWKYNWREATLMHPLLHGLLVIKYFNCHLRRSTIEQPHTCSY